MASRQLDTIFQYQQLIQRSNEDPEINIPNIVMNELANLKNPSESIVMFFSILFGNSIYKDRLNKLRDDTSVLKNQCNSKNLEFYYYCHTCSKDSSAALCGECIENPIHKHHSVDIKQSKGSAFCDCGNSYLWKPSGFCSKHSNILDLTQREIDHYLTPAISQRANILFDAIGQLMQRQFLIRETDSEQRGNTKRILFMCIGIISSCLTESTIFTYFLTRMFARIYPYVGRTNHECPELIYIDDEHKEDCARQLQRKDTMISVKNSSFRNRCQCTILSNFFRYDEKFTSIIFNQAIFPKMIQYSRFKIAAGFAYLQNYQALLEAKDDENSYITIGSSILTIPEVSNRILDSKSLRNILLQKFEILVKRKFIITAEERKHIFKICEDIQSILGQNSSQLLVENRGITDFLDMLRNISFIDSIQIKKNPILNPNEGYFLEGADYNNQAAYISINILTNIDYLDMSFNKNMMKVCCEQISTLKEITPEKWNGFGYLNYPVLSFISSYITFFSMSNLIAYCKEQRRDEKDKAEYLKELFADLFSQSELTVDEFAKICIGLSSRSIGFLHEIKSNKWKSYEKTIYKAPQIKNENDFILMTLLMSITENPSDVLNDAINFYSIDGTVKEFYSSLLIAPGKTQIKKGNMFEQISNIKRFLYFICSALTNERKLFSFMSSHSRTFTKESEIESKIRKEIESFKNSTFDCDVIHTIMKTIELSDREVKSNIPTIHQNTENLDSKILNFCIKDSRDKYKLISCIKRRYLKFFNPLYYCSYEEFLNSLHVYEKYFKKPYLEKVKCKPNMNDPLNPDKYQAKFMFDMIKLNFLKTDLVEFLMNLLENKDNLGFQDQETYFISSEILYLLLQVAVELKKQNVETELTEKLKELILARSNFTDSMYSFCWSHEIALFCNILSDKDIENYHDKYAQIYGPKRNLELKDRAHRKFNKTKERDKKVRNGLLKIYTLLNLDEPKVKDQDQELSDEEIGFVEDIGSCVVCEDELLDEDFEAIPFGYVTCVSKSHKLVNSKRQTLELQKLIDRQFLDDENAKQAMQNLILSDDFFKSLNIVDSQYAGIQIICCSHMAHYKCLEKCRGDQHFSRGVNELEDLSESEFKCNECDTFANALIISYKDIKKLIWRINNYEQVKDILKTDFSNIDQSFLKNGIYEALNQVYSFYEIEDKKEALTPENFDDDFLVILEMVVSVTAYMIELVDLKGTSSSLNSGSAISLVENLSLLCTFSKPKHAIDIEGYIHKVLFSENNDGKNILNINVTNMTIKLLIYAHFSFLCKGEQSSKKAIGNLMKICFAMYMVQIAAKCIYIKNSFVKPIDMQINRDEIDELIDHINDEIIFQGIKLRIIDLFNIWSLPFLRKVFLAVSSFVHEEKNKEWEKCFHYLSNDKFVVSTKEEVYMIANNLELIERDIEPDMIFSNIYHQIVGMHKDGDNTFNKLISYYFKYSRFDDALPSENFEENKEAKSDLQTSIIPVNLFIINSEHSYRLVSLPSNLEELKNLWEQKSCSLCDKVKQNLYMCLICGEYICSGICTPSDKQIKGNLTEHAFKCDGGCSIYLSFSQNNVVYIFNGYSCCKKLPYSTEDKKRNYNIGDSELHLFKINTKKINKMNRLLYESRINSYTINNRDENKPNQEVNEL